MERNPLYQFLVSKWRPKELTYAKLLRGADTFKTIFFVDCKVFYPIHPLIESLVLLATEGPVEFAREAHFVQHLAYQQIFVTMF